ncbi:MAG: VOC family protein [Myxococcota bacterium]
MSDKVAETAEFYCARLGFEKAFEADWYVSLRHKRSPQYELAILRSDHQTIPDGHQQSTRGLLINIEVSDAKAEYERLITRGKLPAHLELRDEEWGQRHFITSDPSGNLIDVIENISVAASYGDAYAPADRAG